MEAVPAAPEGHGEEPPLFTQRPRPRPPLYLHHSQGSPSVPLLQRVGGRQGSPGRPLENPGPRFRRAQLASSQSRCQNQRGEDEVFGGGAGLSSEWIRIRDRIPRFIFFFVFCSRKTKNL